MKKEPRDTVSKSLLLNWLSLAEEDLPVEELNKWLTAKTKGRYTIVKNETRDNSCLS